MRGVARLNDRTIGTCSHPSHDVPLTNMGGKIITARGDVYTNNRPTARQGDTVLSDCGHKGKIITSASTVETSGASKNIARLGDTTEGDYVARIITASGNVFPTQ